MGAGFALAQNVGPAVAQRPGADQHPSAKPCRSRRPGTRLPLHGIQRVAPERVRIPAQRICGALSSNADGYLRRAGYYAAQERENPAQFDKAAADMEQALRVSNKKDDVHYNIARLYLQLSAIQAQRNLPRLDL